MERRVWRLVVTGGLALVLAGTAGCARSKPGPKGDAVSRGRALFTELACHTCHSTDGTAGVGPTMKGLYGSRVKLVGGETLIADDAYLRESITDPDAKVVDGYAAGVMSAGVAKSRVEQGTNVADLVAYIKTIK